MFRLIYIPLVLNILGWQLVTWKILEFMYRKNAEKRENGSLSSSDEIKLVSCVVLLLIGGLNLAVWSKFERGLGQFFSISWALAIAVFMLLLERRKRDRIS